MDKFDNLQFPPIFPISDTFDVENEQKLNKEISEKLDEAIEILDAYSKNGLEEYERARNKLYALKTEIDKDNEINYIEKAGGRQELFDYLEGLKKLFIKGVILSKNTIYVRGYLVVSDVKNDLITIRY